MNEETLDAIVARRLNLVGHLCPGGFPGAKVAHDDPDQAMVERVYADVYTSRLPIVAGETYMDWVCGAAGIDRGSVEAAALMDMFAHGYAAGAVFIATRLAASIEKEDMGMSRGEVLAAVAAMMEETEPKLANVVKDERA